MPVFKSTVIDLEKVTQERDSCLRELNYLREQYQQKVRDQKEDGYGWYADPEEVKKAEMEFSSTIVAITIYLD